MRCAVDVDAVIEGVVSGAIDVIATDHAPHAGNDKMQEFERCPFGITGLETAIALTLETLVHPGKISLMRMVELFTTGPARVLKLGCGTHGDGNAGRCDRVRYGAALDIRCESFAVEKPKFPVRREAVPRRSRCDNCEWTCRLSGGPLLESGCVTAPHFL